MKSYIVFIFTLLLSLLSHASQGQTFICTDKAGDITFSDAPCQTTSKAERQKYNEKKHREDIYNKKLNHFLTLFKSQKFNEAKSYAEKNNQTNIYQHAVNIHNAEVTEAEARKEQAQRQANDTLIRQQQLIEQQQRYINKQKQQLNKQKQQLNKRSNAVRADKDDAFSQCVGQCAAQSGICIAQCGGNGQCIGSCGSQEGVCISNYCY